MSSRQVVTDDVAKWLDTIVANTSELNVNTVDDADTAATATDGGGVDNGSTNKDGSVYVSDVGSKDSMLLGESAGSPPIVLTTDGERVSVTYVKDYSGTTLIINHGEVGPPADKRPTKKLVCSHRGHTPPDPRRQITTFRTQKMESNYRICDVISALAVYQTDPDWYTRTYKKQKKTRKKKPMTETDQLYEETRPGQIEEGSNVAGQLATPSGGQSMNHIAQSSVNVLPLDKDCSCENCKEGGIHKGNSCNKTHLPYCGAGLKHTSNNSDSPNSPLEGTLASDRKREHATSSSHTDGSPSPGEGTSRRTSKKRKHPHQ